MPEDAKERSTSGTAEDDAAGRSVGVAFVAFALSHAGCGGELEESRLDERSLACRCPGCDELRIFVGAAGDA